MECKNCGEEADQLVKIRVGNKTMKVCEQCADQLREEAEIASEAEGAMRDMMGYKGR